jgi:hypothetical protein
MMIFKGIIEIWLLQADVDGDGALNYGEFVAVSVHLKKMGNDEHLHKAFAFFDQNQSGYIEIEELRDALNDEPDANSEEVINAIMHDVDTDKVSIEALFSSKILLGYTFFLTFELSKGQTIWLSRNHHVYF